MIYLVTALYLEASPLLELLSLKKNTRFKRFQVFSNETFSLIITGVGTVAAATATAYLLSVTEPTDRDMLINFGCCGSSDNEIGTVVIGNKLIEVSTNRCYYPDILYRHDFLEQTIQTVPNPVTPSDMMQFPTGCVDMEAASVYQAASYFLRPDQIVVIKAVTDHGIYKTPPTNVGKIIKLLANEFLKRSSIFPYEYEIPSPFLYKNTHNAQLTSEEESSITILAAQMKLSVTMLYEFRQIMIYKKLLYGDISNKVNDIQQELAISPCKSKLEGKIYLGKLKSELFI